MLYESYITVYYFNLYDNLLISALRLYCSTCSLVRFIIIYHFMIISYISKETTVYWKVFKKITSFTNRVVPWVYSYDSFQPLKFPTVLSFEFYLSKLLPQLPRERTLNDRCPFSHPIKLWINTWRHSTNKWRTDEARSPW